MEPEKLKQIMEAALLAADEPLTVDQLAKLFKPSEIDKNTIRADIREVLKALTEEAEGRGYELARVASGYRYQVRQELSLWISRLWEEKPPRYTRALLETLALVAYKQPVTRGDIEQVRGVSVSQNIMRTLLERGWIRVVGQREVPGRPSMYGTTKEFLDYFNLKSLDQLPPLAEIRELIEPAVTEMAAAETAAEEEVAQAEAQEGQAETAAEGGEAVASEDAAETEAHQEAGSQDDAEGNVTSLHAFDDDDDEDVDLDGEDFDAEIAAAIAAADAASDRFNNPEPTEAETAEADAAELAAADAAASDSEQETTDSEPETAERPQVVDVVTDLEGETEASTDATEQAQSARSDDGQPTAEVVQLPRAPH